MRADLLSISLCSLGVAWAIMEQTDYSHAVSQSLGSVVKIFVVKHSRGLSTQRGTNSLQGRTEALRKIELTGLPASLKFL